MTVQPPTIISPNIKLAAKLAASGATSLEVPEMPHSNVRAAV